MYFLNSQILPFLVALILCVSATDMTEQFQNMLCPLPSTNVVLDQFFNTFTNVGPIHFNPCNYCHTLKRTVKNV
jgi:hypothetical protein